MTVQTSSGISFTAVIDPNGKSTNGAPVHVIASVETLPTANQAGLDSINPQLKVGDKFIHLVDGALYSLEIKNQELDTLSTLVANLSVSIQILVSLMANKVLKRK